MPVHSVHPGPIRVLLLSGEHRTARLIEELLHATWSRVHLVTYPTWDAAAAEAHLDHAGCCVLLDLAAAGADAADAVAAVAAVAAADAADGAAGADTEEAMTLLQNVRMSAPEAPIVVLTESRDERLALDAIEQGAQDCLITSELGPESLRRALSHAIERKRVEARLAHQALHDQLTSLPNRALFLDRLSVALERSRRSGELLAVLFLDCDSFKQINDTRGHAAGDALLATLGERLSGLLRPMDTVARFGGDEFTFLFEGLTSEREVVLIAERICHAASLPVDLGGAQATVTVSIGIAMVNDPTVAPEAIIREADAAMYRAKDRGRSRYELFDEDSRRRALERIELEAAIQRAVERCELRVHYQPSLTLQDPGEVMGVEALVRWQHPMRGLIAAEEFMPVANDVGLVIPIGRFVLQHALTQLARWRARKPDITISLNISAAQLRDPALPALLLEALDDTALDPAAVCLEIAEHELAEDPSALISELEALKAIGVRIAIDDFGAGASPLSRLRDLPVDALKIHHSFIARVEASPEDASVLGALVQLGHALGLAVVAEGVETEGQLEHVRELGCDAAQGYAIGRPVSEEQLEALLLAEVA